MSLKILTLPLLMIFSIPAFGDEPNNAIEWLQFKERAKENLIDNRKIKKKTLVTTIEKSNLKPNNLNSVGIISTKITGIDPNIWEGLDEKTLFTNLEQLPSLNFHSAQRFLKRILISETQPPKSTSDSKMSGKYYFLAKLDKLIDLGALDEAETIILQVPKMNREIFVRWQKISFLTGRLERLCKTLGSNFSLSQNLSVRIVCLKYLNDWEAAALTLSTAASLNLLEENREKLLIHYLDEALMPAEQLQTSAVQLDEIDYFILKSTSLASTLIADKAMYQYMNLKDNSKTAKRVEAAEQLAAKKSISISTLFDIYRNSNIEGSIDIWQRIICIKNLDMALKRNNEKTVRIALDKAIEQMFHADLLFLFAAEYADKLAEFLMRQKIGEFNDIYAMMFALTGETPIVWQNYKANNKLIEKAFNVANNNSISVLDLQDAIKLVAPNLSVPEMAENKLNKKESERNRKGLLILRGLKESAQGVITPPEGLYSSLLHLLQAKEVILTKSILVEYLIQSSMTKS